MSDNTDAADFREFMARVRAGDQAASEELVTKYERLIRREIRLHLADERLKRVFDTVDFSQSILASFFIRASDGEYKLDEPADLIRLLMTMTRNKIASSSRRMLSQKREAKRSFVDSFAMENQPQNADTPSRALSMREILAKAQAALSDEENEMLRLRQNGTSWDAIAEQLGGSAQSRRMQLTRALDRITEELGTDAWTDD